MAKNSQLLDTLESIIKGETKVIKTEKAGDHEGKVLEITTENGVMCFSVDSDKKLPEWAGNFHLVPKENGAQA